MKPRIPALRCAPGAFLLALAGFLAAVPPGASAAERGAVLEDLEDLQRACRQAERPGRRRLYVVQVPSFRLGRYDASAEAVPVDTRRNLRILGGAAELFPADLEPIAFEVRRERTAALRRAIRGGAHLRLGFFLGFDNRHRTLCLLRSSFGVTTVRMDLAFAEIVHPDGSLLARQTSDRLRAWLDDLERDRIPGDGPRGALRDASLSARAGSVPEAWQRALAAANGTALTRAIGRCHAKGIEAGGAGRGQVVVRLRIRSQSGEVDDTAVQLSTVPRDEAECIARVLEKRLRLPPASGRGARVELSVPVHLTD